MSAPLDSVAPAGLPGKASTSTSTSVAKISAGTGQRAVVFAYHNVGVRCIKVLLARGIEVALVVTHEDNPSETIWFESVAALCAERRIACITPSDPNVPELMARVAAAAPEWIFSFYYRHLLPQVLLDLAPRGAYNMHGSLLPRYRGRVPVNWAVLHGETETGATLHRMVAKADAGAIVAQTALPILPDDTAFEVFGKLCVVAEKTLWDVLPAMLAGCMPNLPNDLAQGSYFGARTPADGRIDWRRPAAEIYNLYRAVAPPYPGAWTELTTGLGTSRLTIARARLAQGFDYVGLACVGLHSTDSDSTELGFNLPAGLHVIDNRIFGVGGDGRALEILALLANGQPISPHHLTLMLTTS